MTDWRDVSRNFYTIGQCIQRIDQAIRSSQSTATVSTGQAVYLLSGARTAANEISANLKVILRRLDEIQ